MDIEKLRILFKALGKVKDQLGEKIWKEIRERLVDGMMAREEADYLQDRRRGAAASSLGMTPDEYEDFLSGKSNKASLKPKNYKELWDDLM